MNSKHRATRTILVLLHILGMLVLEIALLSGSMFPKTNSHDRCISAMVAIVILVVQYLTQYLAFRHGIMDEKTADTMMVTDLLFAVVFFLTFVLGSQGVWDWLCAAVQPTMVVVKFYVTKHWVTTYIE